MKNVWKIIIGAVGAIVAAFFAFGRAKYPPKTRTPLSDLDDIRARQRDVTNAIIGSKRLNTKLGKEIELNAGENRSAIEGIDRAIDIAKRNRELIREAKSLIDSLK